MDDLSNRIKEIRKYNGYNQVQFASLIGVDRTTLASWETGRRNPGVDDLLSIARVANISVDWLTGRLNTTIAKARIYDNNEWHKLIDHVTEYNITPNKLNQLINAALVLKET